MTLREIKSTTPEEATEISWLSRARKGELGPPPGERIFDEVLSAMNNSETGIVCLIFNNGESKVGNIASWREAIGMAGKLREFGLKERGVRLQTRIQWERQQEDAFLYIRRLEE